VTRSIILAIEIAAPTADIYRAITTKTGLSSFWTPNVAGASEASTEGAELNFGFAEAPVDLQMMVTNVESDREVRWSCSGPWPHWTGTGITWTIEVAGSGANLVLFRHEGWPEDQPDAEFGSVAMVWAKVLLALDEHVTTGAVVPALQ
jgi:uncharacterized protein YndB with AHSA1/START domain